MCGWKHGKDFIFVEPKDKKDLKIGQHWQSYERIISMV